MSSISPFSKQPGANDMKEDIPNTKYVGRDDGIGSKISAQVSAHSSLQLGLTIQELHGNYVTIQTQPPYMHCAKATNAQQASLRVRSKQAMTCINIFSDEHTHTHLLSSL